MWYGRWGRRLRRCWYPSREPRWRRYEFSREERLRMLERMRDELEAELEDIRREIERLRK